MANKIEKYVKKLRKKNIRMTTQRLAILEYLAIKGNHPTASEIYEALKAEHKNMSMTTIYNNLNFFKEAEILIELPFEEGSSRFDLTETKHFHAICKKCGRIVDFDYPELTDIESYIEITEPFEVEDYKIDVTGLCANCMLR